MCLKVSLINGIELNKGQDMGLGFKELKEHETGIWDAQILALVLQ